MMDIVAPRLPQPLNSATQAPTALSARRRAWAEKAIPELGYESFKHNIAARSGTARGVSRSECRPTHLQYLHGHQHHSDQHHRHAFTYSAAVVADDGTPWPACAIAPAILAGHWRWCSSWARLSIVFLHELPDQQSAAKHRTPCCSWSMPLARSHAVVRLYHLYRRIDHPPLLFICTASFQRVSLYGYTTQRDLCAVRPFLVIHLST